MTSGLADLEARLSNVEKRLAALEGAAEPESEPDIADAAPTLGDGFAALASAHIGRVLLIFGGAYLLRAITEFQFVPIAIGLLMGAVYAVFWLFMAYRKGGVADQRANAAFFGGTSVLLTLPLLHEATTNFPLLTGVQGVVAVAVYCVLALTVAAVRDLRSLAWLATAGGIAAATASLIASHTAVPVAIFLLLLGISSLWAVYWRDWMGLQWLGAVGANLGVLAVVTLVGNEHWSIEPRMPFVIAVSLLTVYLLSFTFHTHVRGRLVGIFEAAQALMAGGLVLGAAVMAVRGGHLGLETAGALGVILGLGGYALAIARDTRRLRYINFFYYSTFALAFLLAGTALLMPPTIAAVIWALLAVAMAWVSGFRPPGHWPGGDGRRPGKWLGRAAAGPRQHCARDRSMPFHSSGATVRTLGRPCRAAAAHRTRALGLGGGRRDHCVRRPGDCRCRW